MLHILPTLVGDEAAVAGVGSWRDPIGASGEEDGAAIVGGGIQLHHRSMDPLATVKNPKYLVIGGRKSRGLQKKGLTLLTGLKQRARQIQTSKTGKKEKDEKEIYLFI